MRKVSIAKIINAVAQFYMVSPKKLQQKSRKAKFTKPRHIAMYLLREELKRSFPSIGRLFGSRDHTTAIHAHRKIAKIVQTSPELKSELEQIKNMLYLQPVTQGQIKEEIKTSNMNKQNKSDKRERFKRLAVYRTNEVLKRLKILGNCANRSAYEYTEEEIEKIFTTIKRKIEEVKAKFHFPKNKEFKL